MSINFKKPLVITEVDLWRDEDTGEPMVNSPNGFVLDWCSNKGFGLFTISQSSNGVYVGDEYMGLNNVERALNLYCAFRAFEEWPVMLRGFGSVRALMAAVTDWESK